MTAEPRAYPKKCWWVVLVALPIVLALITVFSGVFRGGGSSPGVAQTGGGPNVAVSGSWQHRHHLERLFHETLSHDEHLTHSRRVRNNLVGR